MWRHSSPLAQAAEAQNRQGRLYCCSTTRSKVFEALEMSRSWEHHLSKPVASCKQWELEAQRLVP